jgi:hypothetical protein
MLGASDTIRPGVDAGPALAGEQDIPQSTNIMRRSFFIALNVDSFVKSLYQPQNAHKAQRNLQFFK